MNLKNYLHLIFLLIPLFFFCHLLSNEDFIRKIPSDLSENQFLLEAGNPVEENSKITVMVILEPYQKVEVYPEIFEEVECIPFKLGESYRKGDLLLKMKNQFYASQLTKGLKGLEFAKEELKIKESLYKSALISFIELAQAEFNLAAAKAAFDEAERNFQASFVLAPFDGKIGAIRIREFERPIRQKSMMALFNDKILLARFIIPSSLLHNFSIGQIISVTIKDLNKSVPAKLIRIGAEINPVSWTINLEAEINNFDGSLMPGMASFFEISRDLEIAF
jgi:multidrug efflux pump subunit AcrA (membrane-fusion protein)